LKSSNKTKTTWNIVKTIANYKDTINNLSPMNIKDKISNNPAAIANAFNSYFSPVAENLLAKISSRNTLTKIKDSIFYLHQNFSQPFPTMKLRHTTTYEIKKIIHSLNCKNSHGYDEILTRILKASAPYVLSPLTHIFNKILSTGIFPERLKFAEVKPLHKTGDKTDFSNYRPISLLTSFSKIIEKIIHKTV